MAFINRNKNWNVSLKNKIYTCLMLVNIKVLVQGCKKFKFEVYLQINVIVYFHFEITIC